MAESVEVQVQEDDGSFLVPLDLYLKSGVHIGTKFENESVSDFVYKTKPTGLKILDVEKIDNRIKLGGKLLSNYPPEKILLVCRRETGYKPVKKLASITGMRCVVGRYLPGTITNVEFPAYFEPDVIVLCDPWHDKQALKDAVLCNIPVISLVGSNNSLENVDFAIPCNNKSRKSLPLIYYLLGREYLKNRDVIKKDEDYAVSLEDFSDEPL